MTFVSGQTLTAAQLNLLIPPSAPLLGGNSTTFNTVSVGGGMSLSGASLSANWQLALVTSAVGLSIAGGALTTDWHAGTVASVGSGLSLVAGVLTASGTGGTVTQVNAGAGLSGGPINTTGTIVANYQAGVLSSFHAGLTLSAGVLTPDWNNGVVTASGLGIGINGGTISSKSQVTVNATAGATVNIAPTGAQSNWMVNGPASGGTVTLTGSFTPGQTISVNVSNGATATNFVLGAGFQFSTSLPSYTSTAVANKRDILAIICNTGTVGDVAAINQGFSP